MGTSASNSGPRDKTPLLPSWAQGAPAAPPVPPKPDPQDGPPPGSAPSELAPEGDSPSPASDPASSPDGQGQEMDGSAAPPADSAGTRGPWTLARRAMGSAVKGGGSAKQFKKAGRRYVAAKGGASKAAGSSTSGRATTARIGGFLSDVASRGFVEAARSLGIEATVGQKIDVVLAAVINAIAPSGTTNDDAIARRASSETLREMFEKHGVEQNGVEALNAMTPADVAETVELSVSAYVYQQWLFELSKKIEEHAVSETQAVRLERDVKTFVRGLVKLKLDGNKAIQMDWKGAQGQAFVREIFESAYSLLGGRS